MKIIPSAKLDVKSLFFGVVLAMCAAVLLGAEKSAPSLSQLQGPLFLVLESTPIGDPANGHQSQLLKVCRHYGKIDGESLKFRLAKETQEIKLILNSTDGNAIRRGDIVGFESFRHLKLDPGSSVTRHLPSGGQEQVP
jgi:hypothetical protein